MLGVILPIFDSRLQFGGFSIHTQEKNSLLRPQFGGSVFYMGLPGVEILELADRNLIGDKDVIMAVDESGIYADLSKGIELYPNQMVLYLDFKYDGDKQEDIYAHLLELRKQGFKFASRKIEISKFKSCFKILDLCDYIIIDAQALNPAEDAYFFKKNIPHIKTCLTDIVRKKELESFMKSGCFDYYSGAVFNMHVSEAKEELSPMKANYLQLLETINEPDFDLVKAADVIGRDTALVFSMLKMASARAANSPVTSIRHAVAMLGQKELTTWMNAYIAKELLCDKPEAIVSQVMTRAKFAELLAKEFGMEDRSAELFLMGLMSLIDYMLGMPMKEALSKVNIAKSIKDALLTEEGDLAEVLFFVEEYETGSWAEVSRIMLLKSIDEDAVYRAYLDTMRWFRDVF